MNFDDAKTIEMKTNLMKELAELEVLLQRRLEQSNLKLQRMNAKSMHSNSDGKDMHEQGGMHTSQPGFDEMKTKPSAPVVPLKPAQSTALSF